LSFPLTHNFDSPNSAVICASEDERQYLELGPEDNGFEALPRLLARPKSYHRIWDDRSLGGRGKFGNVTIWQPIPPTESYAALGCIATPVNNLKSDAVPQGELCYCVHKSVLLNGIVYASPGKYRNRCLWCTEQQANSKSDVISIFEVHGVRDEGVSSGAFHAVPSFNTQAANEDQVFVFNISWHSRSWE